MPVTADPAVHRRKLRGELRRARERALLTQQAAADQLDWSVSKLLRIESGAVGVSVTDLKAMLDLYQVKDEGVVASLVESARASKGRAWWHEYRDIVKPQFAQYLGYEATASDLKVYTPTLIPGLLQNEETASAIITLMSEGDAPPLLAQMIALRVERHERLFEREDLHVAEFIIDESALRRPIGSRSSMQRELRYLRKLADHPKITMGVTPLAAGFHPGLAGPFVVAQSVGDEDDVLYVEGPVGDLLIRDDPEAIYRRLARFETMREISLFGDDFLAVLDGLIAEYGRPAAAEAAAPSTSPATPATSAPAATP